MSDSVFTKIIKGELPCFKIYEDDKTLAFLDIHPVTEGHTLVIPKKQVEFVWDLDDVDYQALMATCKKVALHLRKVFKDKERIGVHIEGLDVPHAHIKLFPFDDHEEFFSTPDQSAEPDFDRLAKIAGKPKMNF